MDGNDEQRWMTNQVVWSRWPIGKGGKDLWFPALIIDPNDSWTGLQPSKRLHKHVLWLGDGRISRVAESNVRDFCQHFKECYPAMAQRKKYRKATKIAVHLAAERANENETFEEMNWVDWATKNMHRFIELSVSDRFYSALHRREESMFRNKPSSSSKQSQEGSGFKKRKRSESGASASCSRIDQTANDANLNLMTSGELICTLPKRGRSADSYDMEKIITVLDRGWMREICYRKATASNGKQGDVYYIPPTVYKKLRSGREVTDFLAQQQDAAEFAGIDEEFFCFRDTLLTGHANESTRHAL